ncbi:hypothetical protein [Variovorax sp. PAMC 28711]|uniref:hypothetical protein n=1 Tax=Variovorax sp. PAMC 28711 TaxID=1795631 RepID=UPI00078C5FA3|nr:hypothetical protein [Variovorax sp. PAMC 28711]AMM23018.1 hypothetical protein AX767_00440 [Variovorax sp. PAMC 28711]
MKKNLLLIAAAALLSGCVTPGPFARQSAGDVVASDPTSSCMARLNGDPFIVGRLGEKMGIGRQGAPTVEMLADRTYPNATEKQALGAYANARESCIASGSDYRRQNMTQQIAQTMEQGGASMSILVGKLYAGDLTYGEYNARRVEIGSAARARMSDVEQQQRQASAQEQANRSAAFGQALQNAQTQQLIQQQRRATTTNCSRFGNQLNCTTY